MTEHLLAVPSAVPATTDRREHGSALRSEGAPLPSLQSSPETVEAGRIRLNRACFAALVTVLTGRNDLTGATLDAWLTERLGSVPNTVAAWEAAARSVASEYPARERM